MKTSILALFLFLFISVVLAPTYGQKAIADTSSSKWLKDKQVSKPAPEKNKKDKTRKEEEPAEEEKKETKDPETALFNKGIMFLIGYNFDFKNSLSSQAVGILNFYSPASSKDEVNRKGSRRWGFNCGIMHIDYHTNELDNISPAYYTESVYASNLPSDQSYTTMYNKYSTVVQNSINSVYFQPLYKLSDLGIDKNSIYLHGHMELLSSSWTAINTISALQKDKPNNNPSPIFRRPYEGESTNSNETTITNKTNYVNGYFGLGLTLDLQPTIDEGSNFFCQFTAGLTTHHPQLVVQNADDPTQSAKSLYRISPSPRGAFFTYTRANYIHKLSEKSSLIIGSDIRNLWLSKKVITAYSVYLGLNLNIDKILGLFGHDAKEKEK